MQAPSDDVAHKKAPEVSIVLPVYNCTKELPVVLSELDAQSFRDKELIIVDDGSSDGTWEAANALCAGRGDVILIKTEHRGPSHARNTGFKRSQAGIIFFAESDCVYDPLYLERAVDKMSSAEGIAAVCLTGAPLIKRATLATGCIDIENRVQHRLLKEGRIEPFYAWVYRRDVLVKLGGFDERLFQGEDRDLFSRLKGAKYEVAWIPGVHWRHIRDQTLAQLGRKWITRGRTRLLYLMKHRRITEIAKSVAPLWGTVVGIALLPFSTLWGGVILLLVAAAFLARSLRIVTISWPLVSKKRTYLGYPLFIIVRNFSTAIGYTAGFLKLIAGRLRGNKMEWGPV